ncbi:hypothetical protein [Globicatella sanguinis]|uniref:hypothetical protein n=1 Tax=Globicatella sanguinis TaxID=13076 RepID=UPI0008264DE6|nr:hypothetical protein [Globicatella sanguinis]MDK7631457.1 hypothetical protein [Globicatella sanguinis]WIK66537.1 hypothetical protein CYJ72_000025 [Globicatella sanguinis]WKT55942.1 hypothetical protein Q3C38_00025 [Globicatella sanguinis]
MSKKFISFLTFVLLTILVSLVLLFMRTQDSIYRAEDEAVKLISYDFKVENVNKFYWSTTDKTYFAVDFNDDRGQQHYAIITQEGGETNYYTKDEIITEDEATSIVLYDMQPDKIVQMRLAQINQEPIWEATIKNNNGTITYYIISAKDGTWIQTIENI